ncbi:unnamed protein product [Moneuplotes crassus]|uniref:Uncharacterized protein n=1 Tax=Euplotes crassus TaxID=5936 RepID=A0AAD1XEQ7_EUPCR|nr:unnamed protein product [Moneuplotes crassus]
MEKCLLIILLICIFCSKAIAGCEANCKFCCINGTCRAKKECDNEVYLTILLVFIVLFIGGCCCGIRFLIRSKRVKKILKILMVKRMEKAKNELDLQSYSEHLEEHKISDNSMSSFFKISSKHMREGECQETIGNTFDDSLFTMYRVGCTAEEFNYLCNKKLKRDKNPYKNPKATKVGFNNAINNNHLYESHEEDLYSQDSMVSESPIEGNEYGDSKHHLRRKAPIKSKAPNNNLKSQPTASEINAASADRKRNKAQRSSIVCSSQAKMQTNSKDEDKIGVYEEPKSKKKKRRVIRKRVKKNVKRKDEVIHLETYMWEQTDSNYKSHETQNNPKNTDEDVALEYYRNIARDKVSKKEHSLQSHHTEERKE